MKDSPGISLLEFWLATAILFVVAGTAIHSFSGIREITQLKREAFRFEQILEQDWLLATAQRMQVTLRLSNTGYFRSSHSTPFAQHVLPDGMSIDGPEQIWITERGFTQPATVSFQNSAGSCSIIISLYGHTRSVCKRSG